MIEGIIIDFDDTLVYSNMVFVRARRQAAEIIASSGTKADNDEIIDFIDYLDQNCVKRRGGMCWECFPQALVDAYRHFCQRDDLPFLSSEAERLDNIGRDVFAEEPKLVPFARQFLRSLRDRFPLVLLSQGDRLVQITRIKASGLDSFFGEVIIVPQKTSETFSELVAARRWHPERCLMIGNSVRSDINTAAAAGLQTVLVHLSPSWSYEVEELASPSPLAESLEECLSLIEKMI